MNRRTASLDKSLLTERKVFRQDEANRDNFLAPIALILAPLLKERWGSPISGPPSWLLLCVSLGLGVVGLITPDGAIAQSLTPQLTDTVQPKPVSSHPTKAVLQEPTLYPDSRPDEPLDLTAQADSDPVPISPVPAETPTEPLDLDPAVIEGSPVLQQWLEEVPNVQDDIRHDPSFRTRLRAGYVQFPSTDDADGLTLGIEDVFIGRTGATLSADVQTTVDGDRQTYGADLRYYVFPLGSYVNLAPVVGYRRLETDEYATDGVNLGLRLQLALSRTGAADLSVTQTWVNPGQSDEEVGITSLSVGYAVTRHVRLSTHLQRHNAPQDKDSRFGIGLEWML